MEQESGLQKDWQRHYSVQLHAYRLWEERGQPWDTPETDWFKAEHELHAYTQDVAHEPATVVAAKVVGSVLGSVAGLVTSVTNSLASE